MRTGKETLADEIHASKSLATRNLEQVKKLEKHRDKRCNIEVAKGLWVMCTLEESKDKKFFQEKQALYAKLRVYK